MKIPRFVDRLVTKTKPFVPEKAWPALRCALSVPGDGPVVGLPAFGRAVVLAPHSDDESIGPGGTIALLSAAGTVVTVVVLTDGSATRGTGLPTREVVARRRDETARSCARLGCGPPQFLGFPDGGLSERLAELAGALATVVGESAPDVVVLPWFGDGHPDHRAVTAALSRTRPPGRLQVWAYETWVPLPANRLVDVSSVIGQKEAALAEHRTAHAAFDVTAMLGLNRFRSVYGLAGHGFAEAFLAGPADRYLKLFADYSRQTLELSESSPALNGLELDSGYFARLDAVRDHWWVRGMQEAGRALLGDPGTALSVLDAGCGVGTNLDWLSELAAPRPVFGVDVADAALERCRRRPARAAIARASVARLPFARASFDVVLSADVLQHLTLEEETAALGELHRVLRPGGRLLVRTNSAFGRAGVVERRDWHLYDRARLEGALAGAGFDVERVTPVNAFQGLWTSLTRALRRQHGEDTKRHGLGLPAPAPPLKSALLGSVLRAEARWLKGRGDRHLPFGHSLYALARRSER